jgi:uncharacterized protein
MKTLSISKTTARRYILGRQGLWPGRRWSGKAGVAQAINQIESVQVDSVVVVARNHDIVLWSRVANYDPAYLDSLLYSERAFFDYGSILMIYPMPELPYWQPIMRQQVENNSYADFARTRPDLIEAVKADLRRRGPLGNRDFTGKALANNGRATKEPGLILNYLWSTGELMTHSRRKFERLYGLTGDIAPAHLQHALTLPEAEAYFGRKALYDTGLCTGRSWANRLAVTLHRRVGPAEIKQALENMVGEGLAAPVQVEGSPEKWYFPAQDSEILAALETGTIPPEWQPAGPTTWDEVTLIAPLDNVIWDRARTQSIFDFDYVWEVYKPANQRRWGYYTLPILYGDRFVARLDPKLDRTTNTLIISGFWLDDPDLSEDPAFAAALKKGLDHFTRFLGAARTDLTVLPPDLARNYEKVS